MAMTQEVRQLFESMVQAHYAFIVSQGGEVATPLSGHLSEAGALVLQAALANGIQEMDDDGQVGSGYGWEDVMCQVSDEFAAAFDLTYQLARKEDDNGNED